MMMGGDVPPASFLCVSTSRFLCGFRYFDVSKGGELFLKNFQKLKDDKEALRSACPDFDDMVAKFGEDVTVIAIVSGVCVMP